MALSETTAAFWSWFLAHRQELAADEITQPLVEQLEERLFAIHRLDWEIGPGRETPNFFALSPRGNRSTLAVTRGIVAQAPEVEGWSFYPAKPPRQWNLVFTLDVQGKEVEIDAKQWQFIAYEFDDGTFDLVFKPDSLKGLPADYLNWAAVIIADGEIGEEKRMELIGNIEVVDKWEGKAAASAQPLDVGALAKILIDVDQA